MFESITDHVVLTLVALLLSLFHVLRHVPLQSKKPSMIHMLKLLLNEEHILGKNKMNPFFQNHF
ncbi:hypothetical protein MtrunA17_Chr2g0317571 [Medicago truncatula]|nr:hypothetical protein MtrunA17_Chr2g0317571 [Medicago truncatula]